MSNVASMEPLMESIIRAFRGLIWFIYQAVVVGGIGSMYFMLFFAILVAVLAATFSWTDSAARRSLIGLLLSLPAIWIFVGLWGGMFWVDLAARPVIRNPDWARYPLIIAPLLFVMTTGLFIWRLRGARFFTLTYSFMNLYFMLFITFLSGMATSGTWL